MPRATLPKSARLKGYIAFMGKDMGISIPIFAYKKNADVKTIDLHMYHIADHGRIRYFRVCEDCHEKVSYDDIVKLTEWGDKKIEITEEELDSIFDKTGHTIKVISPFSLTQIEPAIQKNIFMLKEVYEIRPFKADTKKSPTKENALMLASLLKALESNKQALLVKTSIDRITRYAIILPNGDMWTLYYQEEIREDIPFDFGDVEKELLAGFKAFLKSKQQDISAEFSYSDMEEELNTLIEKKMPAEAMAVGGENPIPDVSALLKSLKASTVTTKKTRAVASSSKK